MNPATKKVNTITTESIQVVTSSTPRRLVTQDNALINACYQMNLDEKRLLMLGISKIDSRFAGNDRDVYQFEVTASEWHTYFGGSKDSIYNDMKIASEMLMTRQLEIKEDRARGINRELMQWVDRCRYLPGEGKVQVQFGSTISTYLTGLASHFTKTDLINVGTLRSINVVRVYELLSQFRDTGYRIQQLDELKEIVNAVGCYPEFNDFKRRVIQPCVDEITKNTDLCVTWEPIKTGRKITAIKFLFKQKEQLRLAL